MLISSSSNLHVPSKYPILDGSFRRSNSEARHGVEYPLCATLGQHFGDLHQHFFFCSEHPETRTAETWRFQHHVGKLLPFLPGIVEATHLEYLRPKVSHFVSVSVSMCRSHVLPAWPPVHMRFSRNGYGQINRALTTSFEVARYP